MDQDLSPLSKRKQKSVKWPHGLLKVFEKNNGETLETVQMFAKLWRPCRCSRNSKVNHLRNGSGKRCRKCFEKLVSEDSWNERVKCMRVPDWMYLLFKLESRTVADEACKNWAKIQGFLCKLIFDLKTFW